MEGVGWEEEGERGRYDFKVSARAADAKLAEAMEVAELETKFITASNF